MSDNILINGDFKVWQRGTSFKDNHMYNADRWITTTKNNITKTDTGIYIEKSTAESNVFLRQRIHVEILKFLKNKSITFSAKVKNAGVSLEIYDRLNKKKIDTDTIIVDTKGQFMTITKTYRNFSYDANVQYLEFSVIGRKDDLEVQYAKLEIGENATENVAESFSESLLRCLPYYEKSYTYNDIPGTKTFGSCVCMYKKFHHMGTYAFNDTIVYKAPKRVSNPTLKIYSPNNGVEGTVSIWFNNKWNDILTSNIKYYSIAYGTGPNNFTFRIKPPSEDSTNIPQSIHSNVNFHYVCDAEIY